MLYWLDLLNLLTTWPWEWRRRAMTEAGVGWLALSTCVLAGATFNPFAKALSPALSPLSLVFLSEVLVLLFVLMSYGAVPILHTLLRLERRDVLTLAAMGLVSGLAGPLLWFTGLSMTTAVNAVFFGRSEMVFLLVGGALFLDERVTRAHVLAMCTIAAGIAVISLQGFTTGLHVQAGDLVIIAAALVFATGSILCRRRLRHVQPHIILGSRSMTALAGFLVFSLFVPHSMPVELAALPATLVPALVGFGFISRFINSVSFYEALKRLPISTISFATAIDVILSAIVAWAMLGEAIRWFHFLGGAFILLGILLLEFLGMRASEKTLEHHVRQRHR